MYNYIKYLFLFLSILSLSIELYLVIYANEVYDKRLYIFNMLFIYILAFPTTIIALPILFGISILMNYFFPNVQSSIELSRVLGHVFLVLLVYLQWFIMIPKTKNCIVRSKKKESQNLEVKVKYNVPTNQHQ